MELITQVLFRGHMGPRQSQEMGWPLPHGRGQRQGPQAATRFPTINHRHGRVVRFGLVWLQTSLGAVRCLWPPGDAAGDAQVRLWGERTSHLSAPIGREPGFFLLKSFRASHSSWPGGRKTGLTATPGSTGHCLGAMASFQNSVTLPPYSGGERRLGPQPARGEDSAHRSAAPSAGRTPSPGPPPSRGEPTGQGPGKCDLCRVHE